MTRRSLLYCLSAAALGLTDAVFSASSAQAAPQPPPPTTSEASMETRLLQLVNKERSKLGLPALSICSELSKAARTHTANMASSGILSHDDADGHFARERVKDAGYGAFMMLGENLAMNAGFANPVEMAVQGWMKSEGHRVNVIDPQYTQTGVGVVEKNGKVYFTQVYALPASVSG